MRINSFDGLGRIISECDQFFEGKGGDNVICYFYDDHGRLGYVIDPVGRASKLRYFDDCASQADCFAGMLNRLA